jgi:hypothetical protein
VTDSLLTEYLHSDSDALDYEGLAAKARREGKWDKALAYSAAAANAETRAARYKALLDDRHGRGSWQA